MSAYGTISRPSLLPAGTTFLPREYLLPSGQGMTVFHFSATSGDALDEELLSYVSGVFAAVVEEGRTYPQLDGGGVQGFVSCSIIVVFVEG